MAGCLYNSPHCCQSHQAPPEGVKEGPGAGRIILQILRSILGLYLQVHLLSKVDQRGECEDSHPHQQHEQAELLVGLHQWSKFSFLFITAVQCVQCNLIESVDETLQPSEVPDQLEDPHHSHHSDQPHYLPSLAHDLKILTNHHFFVDKNVSITVPAAPLSQGPT